MLKNMFVIGLLFFLTCQYGFAAKNETLEANKNAYEILQEVSKILALDNIRSEQVMTVCRKDATIRQYRLRIMTSGSDKAFAEIIAPKKLKGRQLLRLNDTVWAYFPDRSSLQSRNQIRVKRPIRVSGRDNFMGSDFSNNDVLRLNFIADYKSKIVEDLHDQYILELKGKDLKLTYSTLRLYVRKGDSQPIKMECYSISDKLVKSVFYQDYRDFGEGLTRPGMLEVKSAILPKSKTFLEIIYLKRGVNNPAKRFLRDNLGN